MEPRRSFFQLDIYILMAALLLVTIGIFFVYSSGVTASGTVVSREYVRQIAWAISGLVIMFGIMLVDLRWLRRWTVPAYVASLLLLVVTLLLGRVVNGARSWLGVGSLGIQPSEFAKVAVVLALAAYFTSNQSRRGNVAGFLGGVLICAVPMALILAQPDMGSAMVFPPLFVIVAFVAGVDWRFIAFSVGAALAVLTLVIIAVWVDTVGAGGPLMTAVASVSDVRVALVVGGGLAAVGTIALIGFKFTGRRAFRALAGVVLVAIVAIPIATAARVVLQDYQVTRLAVFLDPYIDPRGAGWNVIQSITAVGSGGFWGQGFLQGTQSHYQFLPQQSTDFIFSILAEEWGFVGVFAVFSLYALLMGRCLMITTNARDLFSACVVAGVAGLFFFHFVVNVGVAIGVMPVTGIPLLLVSYGGSALWTAFGSLGLVLGVHQRRYLY